MAFYDRAAQRFIILSLACLAWNVSCSFAQTTIVFRNLEIVDVEQLKIHEEFLELPGNRIVGWDQIHSASGLNDPDQIAFKDAVKSLGTPLFQIRHRLEIGDYDSLGSVAEPLFRKYATQAVNRNNVRNHFLVYLGCFHGRLAKGSREQALIPYLKLCELHQKFPTPNLKLHQHAQRQVDQLKNGFSESLLPIWFDRNSIANVLSTILSDRNDLKKFSDGKLIYLSALYCCANKFDKAKLAIDELTIRKSTISDRWLPLIGVQMPPDSEIHVQSAGELRKSYRNATGPNRALANYLIARQPVLNKDDLDIAILDLLYIPANFSTSHPELSAAALELAARLSEESGNLPEAKIIRAELFGNYQNTYHGRLAKIKQDKGE